MVSPRCRLSKLVITVDETLTIRRISGNYLHAYPKEYFFRWIISILFGYLIHHNFILIPNSKALFTWSRVPKTTLPFKTTLSSVHLEVVSGNSCSLAILSGDSWAGYISNKIWAASSRAGEPKCLDGKRMTRGGTTRHPELSRPRDEFTIFI